MRPLKYPVGLVSVYKLVSGAGMVDLVKIHAVKVAGREADRILFVDERARGGVVRTARNACHLVQRLVVRVYKRDLVKYQLIAHYGHTQVAGGLLRVEFPVFIRHPGAILTGIFSAIQRVGVRIAAALVGLGRVPQPAVHHAFLIVGVVLLRPVLAVIGQRHREGGTAYAAEVGETVCPDLAQIKRHLLHVFLAHVRTLWRRCRAKVYEREQRIRQRHASHYQAVELREAEQPAGGFKGILFFRAFARRFQRLYVSKHYHVKRQVCHEQRSDDIGSSDYGIYHVL